MPITPPWAPVGIEVRIPLRQPVDGVLIEEMGLHPLLEARVAEGLAINRPDRPAVAVLA